MTSDASVVLQRAVQGQLGRCLIGLQQYEQLLKRLIAHHEVSGPADALAERLEARRQEIARDTLGQLAEALFQSFFVQEGSTRPEIGPECGALATNHVVLRTGIQMSPERLESTRADVRALVGLRNGLVHHFIEQFDLRTQDGCTAAQAHLGDAYARIVVAYGHLRDWAVQVDQARAYMAASMQSQAFEDLFIDGLLPDGQVFWPFAGIVSALDEAGEALAVDGWTQLDAAISWLRGHQPEQCPSRYGCSTWRQVLHESEQFKVRFVVEPDGRRLAWYQRLTG